MERVWLALAGLNGAIGVALGAYAVHGLVAPPDRVEIFRTAVQYHVWHALALFGLALLRGRGTSTTLDIAGALFVVGMILFCGSLYSAGLWGTMPIRLAPPVGGLALIAAWCCLAVFAFVHQ